MPSQMLPTSLTAVGQGVFGQMFVHPILANPITSKGVAQEMSATSVVAS
jgi:hypothetical protein